MKKLFLVLHLSLLLSTNAIAGVTFDGINDTFTEYDGHITANLTGYAISARFTMPDATPAADAVPVYTGRTGIIFLRVNTTGIAGFSYKAGAWYNVLGTTTLQNNTEYVLTAVWQRNARCYVYINGVDDTSGTPNGVDAYLETSALYSAIGSANGGTAAFFPGTIHEIYWFDRAISAEQAMLLGVSKHKRIGLQIDNFAEYMPFDEYPGGTQLSGLNYHDVFDSDIVWLGAGGVSLVQTGEDSFSY